MAFFYFNFIFVLFYFIVVLLLLYSYAYVIGTSRVATTHDSHLSCKQLCSFWSAVFFCFFFVFCFQCGMAGCLRKLFLFLTAAVLIAVLLLATSRRREDEAVLDRNVRDFTFRVHSFVFALCCSVFEWVYYLHMLINAAAK